MNSSLDSFLQSIDGMGVWAYVFIAFLVAVEGPIVTLFGAVAASTKYLQPLPVFASAALGNLAADIFWYSLGYLGKLSRIERLVSRIGIEGRQIRRFEKAMQRQAGKLIFLSKLTLGLMIPALIATGLTRIAVKRWLPPLLIGEFIWTGTLMVTGLYFGQFVQTLQSGFQIFALAGSVLLLFFIGRYLIRFQPSLESEDDGDEY